MNHLILIALGLLMLSTVGIIAALGTSISYHLGRHARHATGALVFVLFMAAAYSLEARACGGYPQPQPAPQIVCAVC